MLKSAAWSEIIREKPTLMELSCALHQPSAGPVYGAVLIDNPLNPVGEHAWVVPLTSLMNSRRLAIEGAFKVGSATLRFCELTLVAHCRRK